MSKAVEAGWFKSANFVLQDENAVLLVGLLKSEQELYSNVDL